VLYSIENKFSQSLIKVLWYFTKVHRTRKHSKCWRKHFWGCICI